MLAMRAGSYQLDWAGLPYLSYLLRHAGSGQSPATRTRLLLTLLLTPRARMSLSYRHRSRRWTVEALEEAATTS